MGGGESYCHTYMYIYTQYAPYKPYNLKGGQGGGLHMYHVEEAHVGVAIGTKPHVSNFIVCMYQTSSNFLSRVYCRGPSVRRTMCEGGKKGHSHVLMGSEGC